MQYIMSSVFLSPMLLVEKCLHVQKLSLKLGLKRHYYSQQSKHGNNKSKLDVTSH